MKKRMISYLTLLALIFTCINSVSVSAASLGTPIQL